jgi:hypothetical protein
MIVHDCFELLAAGRSLRITQAPVCYSSTMFHVSFRVKNEGV